MITLSKEIAPEQLLEYREDIRKAISDCAKYVCENLDWRQYDECVELFADCFASDCKTVGMELESLYLGETASKISKIQGEGKTISTPNPQLN